jgi:hypothetical protein
VTRCRTNSRLSTSGRCRVARRSQPLSFRRAIQILPNEFGFLIRADPIPRHGVRGGTLLPDQVITLFGRTFVTP